MSGSPRGGPAAVWCVGQVMVDMLAELETRLERGSDTPATTVASAGGSAANVAGWLAALGTETCLVAAVGDDALGAWLRDRLRRPRLRLRLATDPRLPTGSCVVLIDTDGQRSMLPSPGANTALPVAEPAGADWLYLSGYALLADSSRPAARETLAAARRAGCAVAIDAASAGPIRRAGAPAVLDWLGGADLLLANVDEARALTGRPAAGPAELAHALAAHTPMAVVKAGADGAWLAGRDGTRLHEPARPARAVDTTGCGDAFAAGVLHERSSGRQWSRALATGASVAAVAATRIGGQPPVDFDSGAMQT